jgi:hypothetical protein
MAEQGVWCGGGPFVIPTVQRRKKRTERRKEGTNQIQKNGDNENERRNK